MYKKTMNTAKLIGIGAAVGAAAYCIGSKMTGSNKKCIKKKAGKAINAMGDIVDGIQYMFK